MLRSVSLPVALLAICGSATGTEFYPPAELKALQVLISDKGFACSGDSVAAQPMGFTGDTVTIKVVCAEAAYNVELFYNGAASVTPRDG